MRTLMLLVALAIGPLLISAEDKPAPTMPEEVTLTSGRVLRKVQVVRWEKERVVLKHAGGVDPIAFSIIKSPSREELEAMRVGEKQVTAASKPKETAEEAKPVEVRGVAFDRGVDLPFIFAGMRVVAMPAGTISSGRVPDNYDFVREKVAEATTDPKGEFRLSLKPGTYQIYAMSTRHYRHGATRAIYRWLLDVDARTDQQLTLTKENASLGVDVLR